MNTNIKALSNEELEIISGGTDGGFVGGFKKGFKKGLKISWKIIEVVGVIGGVMFLGYAGRSIYESHKKKGSN